MNTAGKAPGVYVQPIDAPGPIVGVGTSTAAMIGKVAATNGVTADKAVPVTSWSQFTQLFGDLQAGLHLPFAVRGFFANGGSSLHVIPLAANTDLATADLSRPIDALTRIPEVKIVCAPGITNATAQKALIAHCAAQRNRFAVLDGSLPTAGPTVDVGPLITGVNGLSRSEFAAVYWPWIVVDNPKATDPRSRAETVPPSGHIAGIMARSDERFGVHKAPANEEVREALDLSHALNDTEQGKLNDANINAIRRFAGRPPTVWGARTLSDQSAWRYVNVRRLVSFIEESIVDNLRWAVFVPNNVALWKSLERTVSEFLTRVWQSGALFGRTAADAFYVRIDEELNPEDVRKQGQVVIEIGVAPVQPAEFVFVRLGLVAGGA